MQYAYKCHANKRILSKMEEKDGITHKSFFFIIETSTSYFLIFALTNAAL